MSRRVWAQRAPPAGNVPPGEWALVLAQAETLERRAVRQVRAGQARWKALRALERKQSARRAPAQRCALARGRSQQERTTHWRLPQLCRRGGVSAVPSPRLPRSAAAPVPLPSRPAVAEWRSRPFAFARSPRKLPIGAARCAHPRSPPLARASSLSRTTPSAATRWRVAFSLLYARRDTPSRRCAPGHQEVLPASPGLIQTMSQSPAGCRPIATVPRRR
jgi:hypothetical protein